MVVDKKKYCFRFSRLIKKNVRVKRNIIYYCDNMYVTTLYM